MVNLSADRVADAPADIWVYRMLPKAVWPYAQLARWDRPIGWWLLLWPCWWSLALAITHHLRAELSAPILDGFFPTSLGIKLGEGSDFPLISMALLFALFLIGAVAMRGAGCTYNDIIDRKLDGRVARTASRPIPSGRVRAKNAVLFLILQALVGFMVLVSVAIAGGGWAINQFAFMLGIASLLVVACYPFAKRVTDWPQLVLGLAFSWGALMGWAVVWGDLFFGVYYLYAGSVLWVIGYDTIYAHQDREDDALIGVRSTARLFGTHTKLALTLLYSGTLVLFALAFYESGSGYPAYAGLVMGCGHMIWQIRALDIDDGEKCLALFQSNKVFGWIVFAGLMLDLVFYKLA